MLQRRTATVFMSSLVLLAVIVGLWAWRQRAVAPTTPRPEPFQNRLALEASPYLQLHAYNPVDWYPWGQAAFVRARA